MNRSTSAFGPRLAVRSALGVVALLATVLLAVHLVFAAGGLLHRDSVSPAEAQNLSGPQVAPIHQAASAACFRRAPGVAAVGARGDDVGVRFVGRSRPMEIRYLKTSRDAIRWSYAHGSQSNFWDNTNWFHTPARLTRVELDALSACLPIPKGP